MPDSLTAMGSRNVIDEDIGGMGILRGHWWVLFRRKVCGRGFFGWTMSAIMGATVLCMMVRSTPPWERWAAVALGWDCRRGERRLPVRADSAAGACY